MDIQDASIPSKALRDNFSEIVDATRDGRRFVVTRNGKPRVALVSLDDLEYLEAVERELDGRVYRERKNDPLIPWERVKANLDAKKRATRSRRAGAAVRRASAKPRRG